MPIAAKMAPPANFTVLVGFLLSGMAARAEQSGPRVIPVNAIDVAFEPELIQADPGDILEFHFMPHNHSVVMGDFENPCKAAKSGGFYSGFFALATGEADQVFRVTVNDTGPLVFYCSQDVPGHQHCQGGMVGAVNSDGAALAKYKEGARQVALAESPAGAFGGTFAAGPGRSSGSSTSSATGASTQASVTTSGAARPTTTTGAAGPGVGRGEAWGLAAAAMGGLVFAAMMV